MFFSKHEFCYSCRITLHWLAALSLIVVGGVILLQKLDVFATGTFGWVWPIIVLVWGIVLLYHGSCKECHK